MALNQNSTTQVAIGADSIHVRALVNDGGWRWSAPGDPNVVHWAADATWTPLQIQTLTSMFATWAAFSNITFQQVTNPNDAEIVLHQTDFLNISPFLGYSDIPGQGTQQAHAYLAATNAGNPLHYTFVPNPDTTDTANPTIVSNQGFELILHEVGHALGLKHPHDGPVFFPGVTNSGSVGSNGLNRTLYTVMSYNHWFEPNRAPDPLNAMATPMAFDIAAIQRLYGANDTVRNGDDTYVLPDPASGLTWRSLWDSGGVDEIVHNGSASAAIELRPATLDDSPTGGGVPSYTFTVNADLTRTYGPGFTIAGDYTTALPDQQGVSGVIIENASGGSGNDEITGNDADNILSGNAGNDTIFGLGGGDQILGNDGDDSLFGGEGWDFINGGFGNDFIDGGATNDELWGLPGDDTIYGGDGPDRLFGNEGSDHLSGGPDNDLAEGGDDGDQILGDDGDDSLSGGEGWDFINGGSGNDFIDGGATNDELWGLPGNDTIHGGEGPDRLFGNEGFDSLSGGPGNDLVDGGADSDSLFGDDGDDVLHGGGNSFRSVEGIDGGAGVDTAVYDGDAANFQFGLGPAGIPGSLIVVDIVATFRDTDLLRDVEFLEFLDATFEVADIIESLTMLAVQAGDIL